MISFTSVDLWVAYFIAWGIIGVVAVTCAYDSRPVGAGPLFIAVVTVL